jgi:phosphatidyl-myo-inositol dimannoside synthase
MTRAAPFGVALVAPEFPPAVGGMETYAYHLAVGLRRIGHHVTVFTKPGHCPELPFGVKVVDALGDRRRHDLPVFDRYSPDVWHVLNTGYAWLASYKSPVFVSAYGNDFLSPWALSEHLDLRRRLRLPAGDRLDRAVGRWLSAKAVRAGLCKADHVFLCSQFSEQSFLRLHPYCRGRTSVAYPGVGEDFFQAVRSHRQMDGTTRLVTVSRLEPGRKNLDVVIHALGRLRNQFSFHYTIIGDGAYRAELERLTAASRLGDVVQFTGRVSAAELRRYLTGADLFVLTSGVSSTTVEGFGIVYLEANACGTPVLAARCGGAVEAVVEGRTGYFVDDPTADQVAVRLARFFRGEVRFSADACREFARKFTWDGLASRVSEGYQAAVQG